MSLLRVSALRAEAAGAAAAAAAGGAECSSSAGPRWLPSHVQVWVGEARGLRLKGGPGDAFAVLQLGRQKHRTAVATRGPRWDEECALELPPAAPEEPDAPALRLALTLWQRALVGPDRFLGRALVPLGPLLQAGRDHPHQWHKLQSKPGKKEKERGEIQLSIHFTRHSLTASMFDLSVKDKPRSPFGKLRDKIKGRRQYDLESASAIVPSSSGALEDDLGLGGRKAKGGSFFFKNRLRKSSLTQSTTSLGSDSTVSSASSMGGMAALEAAAAPSPSRHGSLTTDRSVRDFLPSPKLTHKRAFSDEASQIITLPESRSAQSFRSQNEPVSRSSLCINGSHIYCEEPSPRPAACPSPSAAPPSRPKKTAENFSTGPPALESEPPPWPSSGSSFQRAPQKDPPRFIPSPPILAAQEEDKLSVKTLALSKHRNRVKKEEGAPAESRPVQIAMPMVFSAEAVRGRPPEEAQKEEKRTKPGFFRRGSTKEDGGKSRVAESTGHVAAAAAAAAAAGGPQGEKSSSWFSMKDAQDPSQRPSSPPGLLAATEVTKDTCVWEDRGPPAFLRAGTLQPTSAPQSVSAFEPAAAASPPLDWGDPFDAFATSRLRPEAQRELLPLPHWDAATEGLAGHDPPEDLSPPLISAGLPLQWPSEAEGSPGVAPEEVLVGGGGLDKEPWGTCVESRPSHPLLQGAGVPSGAHKEDAVSGAGLNWKEPAGAVLEAEAATLWGEARWAMLAGSSLPVSEASESNTSLPGSLEKSPPSPRPENKGERLAELPLATSLTSEAETGEAASAGTRRQQQMVLPVPPDAPGPQPTPGKGQFPEEENKLGSGAEEGGGVPSESQERRGEGRQGMAVAPAKPLRTFTSLSLEEEAGEALWGPRERCEIQEGPGVAADGQGPPVRDSSAPEVIGAGGGSVGQGAEALPLPAADDSPARTRELMRPVGSLGDFVPAANEKGARGAKQLETCPGKPGLAGGGGGGEPCSGLSSGLRPQQVPRPPLSAEEEVSRGPSGMPQEPEPSPSMLFWTALEEQLLQPRDGPSSEQPRGLGEGTPDQVPNLDQREGVALTSPEVDRTGSQSSRAPLTLSASPQVLASGQLRQAPRGSSTSDSELSSSWSDDRVIDFKKADFWQAERGEEGSAAPCNPFVSRVSPQNNPFVERPPGVLPAPQCSPAEGPSFRDLHAEAAPQGLLPAAALSQDQPAAPFPHDHQPLAFSTPSLEAAVSSSEFDFPSPIVHPTISEGSAASGLLAAHLSLALPSPSTDAAASSVSPGETQPADEVPAQQTTSPHPVKPISTSRPMEKQRRSSLPLGQEKLKPKPTSGNDSSAPILPLEKTDLERDPPLLDCSAKYYHLTHDELIQLLLKREAELSKKQEHIRELENYIDRLLVRIMEQSPTLLQIPLGGGARAAK